MGTNYYLIRKMKYVPGTPTTLGLDSYDTEVTQLTNGYVCRNTYYPTLDALSKDFKQEIHIGKSSGGWYFGLCIYPKYGINNLEDWKKLFFDPEVVIQNESEKVISPEEMMSIITQRGVKGWTKDLQDDFEAHELTSQNMLMKHFGVAPYRTFDEFLEDNHAERGNNGLLKRRLDDAFHVENPDKTATYDYIISGNDPEEGIIFS